MKFAGLLLLALSFDQVMQQANSARQANRVDDAIKLYRDAVNLKPASPEAWWYLGTLLYDKDDYKAAVPAFQKLTTLQPRGGAAWVMLGLCEFRTAEYSDALAHIHRGRTLGVGANKDLEKVGRYHEAILSNRLGQFEFAMALLTEFAREGDEQASIVEATGIAALRLPYLPTEVPEDKRAVVLQAGKAALAANARRMEDAKRETEVLVAMYPDHPNVHYMKGVLLLQERNEQAFAEFDRELEISPDHVPARVQIAIEYLQRKQPEKALPRAAEAAALAPDNYAARTLHGRALLETGNVAAAVKELEAAVKLAPQSPEAHFALANAYARAGRKQDAARERAVFRKLQSGSSR